MILSAPMACEPNTAPASLSRTAADGHSLTSAKARFSVVSSPRRIVGTRTGSGFGGIELSSTSNLSVEPFPPLRPSRLPSLSRCASPCQA